MISNRIPRPEELSASLGQKVDLAPWAYLWRRDRAVQEQPEAYFIPRRLKRQDEVYRTALDTLGPEMRSICYTQNDLMERQLPKPQGELLTGLLWVGGLTDYRVELVWQENAEIPKPEDIEVRTYPTAWGWFGWTNDRRMTRAAVSEDGRRWSFDPPAGLTMDYAYNQRVPAATEMVAVFAPEGCPVPELHVTGESLGTWKSLTFTVEWGFEKGLPPFTGMTEAHVALVSAPVFDEAAHKATYTCLYSDVSRFGNDSKFTCITDDKDKLGATVLLRELAEHPICVPEAGLFFCSAEQNMTAAEYLEQQKEAGSACVRDRVRAHEEETDWEKLLQKVRLWRCPDGTEIPPFPKAPVPSVDLQVPDKRWETMYRLAVDQLRGPHMWGFLASEVARAALAMELTGLYPEADKIYAYFLASPGVKADGDFTYSEGALEWAKTMRHDMGYAHEGTHFSTGKLLFSMMHRYYMTADREWLAERLPRLKAAANWIVRELRAYMKDTPNREKLHVYGLMPPAMCGDYALPACDRRWYYFDNAFALMGLSSFADVLERTGDPEADYFRRESQIFARDLMNAVRREALYAPVRRASDGMSRSFIPRMAYAGGLLLFGKETNVPQFALGINDLFEGALPLGEAGSLMDALDRRMVGTVNAMEEAGMAVSVADLERLDHPTADQESREKEEKLAQESAKQKRTQKPPKEDLWFWNTFSNLPKISHNADIYLRQDDIPNFLHFFFNHAIVMVGTNGKMWEHAHPDVFVECDNPDNGTAAWFVQNFRNMLLMEDYGALWLMKGTPRAWLEQGKTVEINQAPTLYGMLNYKVTSDVKNGKVYAVIDIPSRMIPEAVKLRLRHPEAKKIRSAELNGKPYDGIDPDGETITLHRPKGRVEITAFYR